MKNKEVSIIIPSYVTEKYISSCIASVLNQTYRKLEIIFASDDYVDLDYSRELVFSLEDSKTDMSFLNAVGEEKDKKFIYNLLKMKINNYYMSQLLKYFLHSASRKEKIFGNKFEVNNNEFTNLVVECNQ